MHTFNWDPFIKLTISNPFSVVAISGLHIM